MMRATNSNGSQSADGVKKTLSTASGASTEGFKKIVSISSLISKRYTQGKGHFKVTHVTDYKVTSMKRVTKVYGLEALPDWTLGDLKVAMKQKLNIAPDKQRYFRHLPNSYEIEEDSTHLQSEEITALVLVEKPSDEEKQAMLDANDPSKIPQDRTPGIDLARIRYCNVKLQYDREVATHAIPYGGSLQCFGPEVRNDLELARLSMKYHPDYTMKYLSTLLTGNKEFCLEALALNPNALQHCADCIKSDKDCVSLAISGKVDTIAFASKDLHCDKEFLFETFVKYPAAGQTDVIRSWLESEKDKSTFLSAVERNPLCVGYMPKEAVSNDEILAAIKRVPADVSGQARLVPISRQSDKAFCIKAVQLDARCAGRASCNFLTPYDREFALALVKVNGLALQYMDERLRRDKEIVLAAAEQNPEARAYGAEILVEFEPAPASCCSVQ